MGTGFNPDGARIKTLRIKRGWTQEQLAEIAGVSSRTVQRAETTGCASFETVRAIAGAFGTDFDQLLESGAPGNADPESLVGLGAATVPVPDPEPGEPAAVGPPARPACHAWKLIQLGAVLAAGLIAGVLMTHRMDGPARPNVSALPLVSVIPATDEARQEVSPDAGLRQVPASLQTAAVRETGESSAMRKPGIAPAMPGHHDARQAERAFESVDLRPQTTTDLSPALPSPDLPLRPRDSLVGLAGPEILDDWGVPSPAADGLAGFEQATGPVRQAVGQAGKKMSDAFGRMGASMKRVF